MDSFFSVTESESFKMLSSYVCHFHFASLFSWRDIRKRASHTLVASLFNKFIMGRVLSDDQLLNLTAAEAGELTNVSRKCCAVCCLKRRRCRNKLNIISFIHFHFQQQADRRRALSLRKISFKGLSAAEERNALVAYITKEERKANNRQRMRKTRAEKRAEDKKKEKAEEASTQ